jgi:hypothetical protein
VPLKQQPALPRRGYRLSHGSKGKTKETKINERRIQPEATQKEKLATKGQKVKGSIKLTLDDTALISHTA